MNEDIRKRFLINNDDTGRFLVTSTKTGKTYFVEAIDSDELTKWGDYNPATKKFETDNYGQKHKGSIKPEESMITEENGFTNIHTLGVGVSPLDYINRIDNEYYEKHMKQ
jgi:hypothetical protein